MFDRRNAVKKILSILTILATLVMTSSSQQIGSTVPTTSRSGGRFYAAAYGRYLLHTFTNTNSGATQLVVDTPVFAMSSTESRTFAPFAFAAFPQVSVDSGSLNENAVPSAASGCQSGASTSTGSQGSCFLTVPALSNAHGAGAIITSATFGLQEAILDAKASGGGLVVVDQTWALLGGTTAMITSASTGNLASVTVWIEDLRGPGPAVLYGKSGSGTAVYSATNNDMVSSGASPFTKTFSQTYAAAPLCVASATGGAVTALTTSTTNAVGTGTGTVTIYCPKLQ
jgi:hypothetical protein